MFSTSSYYVGVIHAAVDEYRSKHGGFGDVRVVNSHIDPNDFTAQAYATSELDGVIFEVERIAKRKASERQERYARQAALRAKLESGELTFEQWEEQYIFSF